MELDGGAVQPGERDAAHPIAPGEDSLVLLRLAQRGDAQACERLFARYYPRVLAIATARFRPQLADWMEAEDVAQDALLLALRSFEGFELRGEARLIGWFATIVENRIRDAQRRAGVRAGELRDAGQDAVSRHVRRRYADGSLLEEHAGTASRPLSALVRSESAQRLRTALAKLDDPQRELILRSVLQGCSWSEIAEDLSFSSPDAARTACVRAKLELGRLLGGADEA